MSAQATTPQKRLVFTAVIRGGIVESIQADPAFAPGLKPIEPALATPFQVGVMDADEGWPFAPEEYFMSRLQKYEYSVGFLSIRPDCQPALAMAKAFEDADWNERQGIEAPYQPSGIDVESLPF